MTAAIKVVSEKSEELSSADLIEYISKFNGKVERMKHIDGRTFAIDFCFPLLLKIANNLREHEEVIIDLEEAMENIGAESDATIDTLEEAKNMLVELASLLDEVMVAAEFCTVSKTGLSLTEKVPVAIKTAYGAIGPKAVAVAGAIQTAISDLESRQVDDEDDEDDEDEEDAEDEGTADEGGEVAPVTPAVEVKEATNGAAQE